MIWKILAAKPSTLRPYYLIYFLMAALLLCKHATSFHLAARKTTRNSLSTLGIAPQNMGKEDVALNTDRQDAKSRNSDENAVFVVSGASRGIGLQFVEELLTRTKGRVVALCRDPANAADDLAAVRRRHGNGGGGGRLAVGPPLDLADQGAVEAAAAALAADYQRVDGLFNVAGVLGDGRTTPGPERSLRAVDRAWFSRTLETNTVGHVMLTQALLPLLVTKGGGAKAPGRPPAVVANVSARVGSIEDNNLGGWYSYRISKAALNMATRTMALELRRSGVWCVALHPGTTDTDLSRPFQANVRPEKLFARAFTARSLLDVVDSLQEKDTGGFYAYDGSLIPW